MKAMLLISNRALMLGSILLLGFGVLLESSPELAHRWLAFVMDLEADLFVPITDWSTVAWRGLALIGGLYAFGTMPLLLTLA